MPDRREDSADTARTVEVAVRWIAVTVAVAATLAVSRNGLVVSPDSTRYLSGAESLVAGDGLLTPTGDPLVLFPPGTSFAYAIGEIVPIATLTWVRILNGLLAGAAVLLTSIVISQHVERRMIVVGATLYCGVSVGVLSITRAAWSEPLYLVLGVVFVALLSDVAARPGTRRSSWIALLAVVWAACLTRYAGFVLIPVGALSLALLARRDALKRALVFVSGAALVPAVWLVINQVRAGSAVGDRPPSTDTFGATARRIIDVIGGWIVPVDVLDSEVLRLAAGVVVGALLVAVVIVGVRSARFGVGNVPIVAPAAALSALAAIAMVGVTQLRTAIDPADARLLSPALLPAVIALAVSADGVSAPASTRLVRIVAVPLAVVLAVQAFGAYRFVDAAAPEPWTYTHPVWQGSEVAASVDALPDDVTILTNDPYAVFALTARRSIDESPRSGEYRSDVVTPFPDEIELTCAPTYLAWFDRAAAFHHPVERIAAATTFVDRLDLADGRVARLATPERCR